MIEIKWDLYWEMVEDASFDIIAEMFNIKNMAEAEGLLEYCNWDKLFKEYEYYENDNYILSEICSAYRYIIKFDSSASDDIEDDIWDMVYDNIAIDELKDFYYKHQREIAENN